MSARKRGRQRKSKAQMQQQCNTLKIMQTGRQESEGSSKKGEEEAEVGVGEEEGEEEGEQEIGEAGLQA